MINWLMQRTTSGATHLQVILLTILLIVMIYACVNSFSQLIKDIKEVAQNDKKKDL